MSEDKCLSELNGASVGVLALTDPGVREQSEPQETGQDDRVLAIEVRLRAEEDQQPDQEGILEICPRVAWGTACREMDEISQAKASTMSPVVETLAEGLLGEPDEKGRPAQGE